VINVSSETEKVTRKLRAILSADVKGYSLLMADDEIHTIQTLKVYRNLMSDIIQQHSGRVVDNPGDNLLAEFSSAVDAVECAVEIQKKRKRQFDSTHPAMMGFSEILKNNPQKSKNH
jgi:adenylate cyclase